MKKKLIGMLCGAAAVSMAVPALAEVTLSGTFMTHGIVQEVSFGKDVSAQQFVAMRMRPKVTNKINDLVTLVYFGEFDIDWGVDGAKGNGGDGRNSSNYNGGGVGGDGVNMETKSLYLDLKPSKDFPLTFRAGLQTVVDSVGAVYFGDDATGLTAMGAFGPVNLGLGWIKLDEGVTAGNTTAADLREEDDTDLYFVKASMKPTDTVKAGVDIFYKHVDGTDATDDSDTEYTIMPNVTASVAGVNIDAVLGFQFGKNDVKDDVNESKSSFMGSVGASMNMAPAMFGVRVIYYGKDGDTSDDTDKSFNGNIGDLAWAGEGLGIFLTDATKTGTIAYDNDNNAMDDAVYNGYGLLGVTAKAKVDFAPFWFKCALGYFQTLTDDNDGVDGKDIEGKALGTEISAEIGMKVAEVASLTLHGDYAMLGSAYDKSVGGEDPDNPYILGLMLSVPF